MNLFNRNQHSTRYYTAQGERHSTKMEPCSDASEPYGLEIEIENAEKSRYSKCAQQTSNDILDNQLQERLIKSELDDFSLYKGVLIQTKTAIKELFVGFRTVMIEAFRKENFAITYTKAFQSRQKLARPAFIPESLMLYYAIMAVMVIVEAIAQASFLVESQGIIQGVQLGLVFASCNVLIGSLVAEGTRFAFDNRVWLRISGIATFLVFVFAFFWVHILLGDYRMALMHNNANAEVKALEYFSTKPFATLDLHAWLMSGVGFVFFLCAILSGLLKRSDLVPGYTSVSKNMESTIFERNEAQLALSACINEVVDKQSSALDEHIQSVKTLVNGFKTTASNTKKKLLLDQFMQDEAQNCYKEKINALRTPIINNSGAHHNLPEFMQRIAPLSLSGLDKIIKQATDNDQVLEHIDSILEQHIDHAEALKGRLLELKNQVLDHIDPFLHNMCVSAKNNNAFFNETIPPLSPALSTTLKV